MAISNSHSHSHVDVDVDPCSFLATAKTIGEDSAPLRGNSEVNCLSKGSSVAVIGDSGGRLSNWWESE